MQKLTLIEKKKKKLNIFRFDEYLEPVAVVVVSHTRNNYFNWALSDWAIKGQRLPALTIGPPCIIQHIQFQHSVESKTILVIVTFFVLWESHSGI